MDKDTRNAIEKATQCARRLLAADFAEQLEGTFDILSAGQIAPQGGGHLSLRQRLEREKIVAVIEHKRAAGMKPVDAVADYLRDAAFTTLNRFVALKMLEARELVQPCVSQGEQSSGYKEFCGLAPGLALLPDSAGYRLYLESLFDELSTEVKVLFDRRDPAAVLWPRRQTFDGLLALLNESALSEVWGEDETIGWVYQYFNSGEERRAMRDASQAPRNSRELAVRNQFFTPRYVVRFLTDNTLGHIWHQMRQGDTRLAEVCEYRVKEKSADSSRPRKDPRDLRVLDPACGSGHFLLYAFDLLLIIYEEAWDDPAAPKSAATGRTLRHDYPTLEALWRELPALVLRHNLHGVDIDPRCAQIASVALWMRAQRAFRDFGVSRAERPRIRRANIVVAEPMPGDAALVDAFARTLDPPLLGELFKEIVAAMRLAGDLGLLLKIEGALAGAVSHARAQFSASRKAKAQIVLPGFEPVAMQAELDFSGIDDDQHFFEEAEARIGEALRRFVGSAEGHLGVRRRLFAEDAAQGLGLIELAEHHYDVVLMNPPFGAGSAAAKAAFERAYPQTKNDVYAAFVERGIELLHPKARLGAITSRTGFFLSSFQKWREDILLAQAPPAVFADLGHGVLDSAMVEVAAYCLEKA